VGIVIPSQRSLDAGATVDARAATFLAQVRRAGRVAAVIYRRRAAGAARAKAVLRRIIEVLSPPEPRLDVRRRDAQVVDLGTSAIAAVVCLDHAGAPPLAELTGR
jgi:hypothetical protein